MTLNNQPMKVVYKNVYDTVWIDTEKGYYSLNKKPLISPVVYYKLLLRGDKIVPVFKVYDLKYFFERLLIFARLKKCKNSFIRVDKKNLEKEYL